MTGKHCVIKQRSLIYFSHLSTKNQEYLRNLDGNKLHGLNEIHPVYWKYRYAMNQLDQACAPFLIIPSTVVDCQRNGSLLK